MQRPLVATDVQNVSKSGGSQKAGSCPFILKNRIGGYRRAVEDGANIVRRDSRSRAQIHDALHHADGRVRTRRGRLMDRDRAGFRVVEH